MLMDPTQELQGYHGFYVYYYSLIEYISLMNTYILAFMHSFGSQLHVCWNILKSEKLGFNFNDTLK